MTTHYHWGQNTPGYLPMADEPNTARTFDEARSCLLADMDHAWDCAPDEDSDEYGEADALDAAMANIRTWDGPNTEYAVTDRPHDLGLAFWVMDCAEEECVIDHD